MHTPIQTYGLALVQLGVFIVAAHALLEAGVCQPASPHNISALAWAIARFEETRNALVHHMRHDIHLQLCTSYLFRAGGLRTSAEAEERHPDECMATTEILKGVLGVSINGK